MGATALGICLIEKHFTLDKNFSGPDHKASATPDELRALVENVRRIETMLGSDKKIVTLSERKNKIGLSDLSDKALDLYERNMITYEKLEYLLEFAELTPEEMGIKSVNQYQPPTDEELDVIMEE